MKIFVTGTAGQLGHDVVNELSASGHYAIGSDVIDYTAAQITTGEAPVDELIYEKLDITDEVAVKAITGTRSMTRGEGAGALFQAAKLIGQADITQDWERICWTRHDEAGEGFWRGWNQELILANFPSAAEPTTFDGQAKDNSCWPAMVWSMGKSSPVSMKTILDYDETYKSPLFGEPLTCEDAICAVLRLYETAAESQE